MSLLVCWRDALEASAIMKLARLHGELRALEGQWRRTAAQWELAAREQPEIAPRPSCLAALADDRITCAEQLKKVRVG